MQLKSSHLWDGRSCSLNIAFLVMLVRTTCGYCKVASFEARADEVLCVALFLGLQPQAARGEGTGKIHIHCDCPHLTFTRPESTEQLFFLLKGLKRKRKHETSHS